MYAENILHHFKEPHHFGGLAKATVSAKESNPLCGDKYGMDLVIDKDGVISDASFTGEGCAISKAAVSMLMDEIIGKPLNEVEKISKENIYELLGVEVSAGRVKCALLGLKILQAAIKKYHEKIPDQR